MLNFKNYKKLKIEELIKLIQKNDFKAMEELVKREQDKIYMTFYYLCPDCDDLYDLTQEALLRMCRGLSSLKNPKTFRGWLNRIISNLFYDELRKKHKHPQCLSTDEEDEDGKVMQICDNCLCPDEYTLHLEVEDIIKETISKLPDNFRLVMVLRELGGLSYEEISKATGIEVGTVKSRINRARHKMKTCLEPYFDNN
ncbi:MAG: sigma-70 family RNA polymerase sigma factor [Candidatus Gastranaerophilales bacterium]|nr:sigma-70 family RNA polymerase sigma factor [Candidatus Gastranaerophilales bacterium]